MYTRDMSDLLKVHIGATKFNDHCTNVNDYKSDRQR